MSNSSQQNSRDVLFTQALWLEENRVVNIFEAREVYQEHNIQMTFKCPDENCTAPFVGVGIKPILPIKKAMHFKILQKHLHSTKCKFLSIVNNHKISQVEKSYEVSQLIDPIPNIFTLNISDSISKKNNNSTGSTPIYHNENSIKTNSYSTDLNSIDKDHRTSQLSRLVNIFTTYSKDFLKSKKQLLSLFDYKPRYFYNCFKLINYFTKHDEPYIFYGAVSNVVSAPNGYYIYFEYKQVHYLDQDKILIPIGIYIPNSLLTSHHRKKIYLEFFESIPKKEKKQLHISLARTRS